MIGEDVTQNLRTVEAIPLRILPSEEIEKNLKKMGLRPGGLRSRAEVAHRARRGVPYQKRICADQ